jgi:LacI family transcriptional regulator
MIKRFLKMRTGMQPTIKDIARSLNVSTATVSNALAGKGRVSTPMAERIRAEAARQGYRPRIAGRALRTGRSGVLGLVLPDLSNPLFPRMAQALQHSAEKAGFGMLIADSHADQEAQPEAIVRLVQRGADGVVVIPRRGTLVTAPGVPVVVIDTPQTAGNVVCADHRGGSALVVRHLLGLGHRHFVFVGETVRSSVQAERVAGMHEACPPGVTADEVWLEDAGLDAVLAQVRNGAGAVCATSDLVALRIISALHSAGLRVPEDASVSGFDDVFFADMVHPQLTSIAADPRLIADHAIAAVNALMNGKSDPPTCTVAMRLFPRQSTGPAPAQNTEPTR